MNLAWGGGQIPPAVTMRTGEITRFRNCLRIVTTRVYVPTHSHHIGGWLGGAEWAMCDGIVLVVVDIPIEPGYAWLEEEDTVALSRHLDDAGRVRALGGLLTQWRRELRDQITVAS